MNPIRTRGQPADPMVPRARAVALLLASIAAGPAVTSAQQGDQGWTAEQRAFLEWASPVAGIYSAADGDHLIVTPHAKFGLLSLFRLESGEVRGVARLDDSRLVFGHGLYPTEPYAGSLEFDSSGTGALLRHGNVLVPFERLPMQERSVRIPVDSQAMLAGLLITPPGSGPFPAALILPSGYSDRYQHWRLAMSLVARGVAALVFDARGSGESSGDALPGHYHSRSLIRAHDAAAAARWLRAAREIDPTRTGVLGWSQGGWLGSLVAGSDDSVAFYVNIAGNLNPGWQQQMHARLSDLRYEGFSDSVIIEAERYFDTYFGTMRGEVSWRDYAAALDAVRQTEWFRFLTDAGLSVQWASLEAARSYANLERDNIPEDDVARVRQPTLGVYFQYDESSPPSSAEIFVRGLLKAGNPDFVLVRLSSTGTCERPMQPRVDCLPTCSGSW